jgi:PKD repeat protein
MSWARWWRWVATGACLIALAAGLAGCWPFNEAPTAVIVATPLSGTSPLPVQFDASGSSDPGGEIKSYSWDFGDGETAEGATVQHTFYTLTEATVFTVELTVVDDGWASDRVTQTIEVLPSQGDDDGGGTGAPVARIVADKVIGLTPLVVSFDAGTSDGGAGSIARYQWHFGDDAEGAGAAVYHTYEPAATEEFIVTLYVWNSEGARGVDQARIIAIVPTDVAGDEEPMAEVNRSTPLLLYRSTTPTLTPTLYEVTFDPGSSYADAGHALDYFVWDFGDGETQLETTDREVPHTFALLGPARTFVVRLTVYDDHGLQATVTANVTLTQP